MAFDAQLKGATKRTLCRGRFNNDASGSTFPWSSAVRGLTYLCLRTLRSELTSDPQFAQVTGARGSLAASLDYAIGKKPNWLLDLFGTTTDGESLAGRFFVRQNPERKRGENVTVSFQKGRIAPGTISIYLDGAQINSREILLQLEHYFEYPESEPTLAPSPNRAPAPIFPLSLQTPVSFYNGTDPTPLLKTLEQGHVLYLPPGPRTADRLMEEIYAEPGLLRVVGYFYRPAITLFPPETLLRSGVSQSIINRNAAAHKRITAGSLSFREILDEGTLWNWIRLAPNGNFTYFPSSFSSEHVQQHLMHYIAFLENTPAYELFFSNASLPTMLSSYTLEDGSTTRHISMYIDRNSEIVPNDYGGLAALDKTRTERSADVMLNWLAEHPTTIRDRNVVLDRVKGLLAYLQSNGPLPPESIEESA